MGVDLSQQIVEQLRRTRKYRFVCDATLHRMADWALGRHVKTKPALKAAKRKLHQVYGAYLEQVNLDRVEALVQTIGPAISEAELRLVCEEILACHVSTAERLSLMADFYADLFAEIGRPRKIVDLACGLHPFAFPFMGLDVQTVYYACDIDLRLVACLSDFFRRIGQPAEIKARDLLVDAPDWDADVVFLLKALPCLEQQEKQLGRILLDRLQSEVIVVSFPARSLGGYEKGMEEHYETVMGRIAEDLGAPIRKMSFSDELFYLLKKN
jgi:16S rRNA (guanine(1405)-N(7))-methyltransferase